MRRAPIPSPFRVTPGRPRNLGEVIRATEELLELARAVRPIPRRRKPRARR
jgi:hypothetical protein